MLRLSSRQPCGSARLALKVETGTAFHPAMICAGCGSAEMSEGRTVLRESQESLRLRGLVKPLIADLRRNSVFAHGLWWGGLEVVLVASLQAAQRHQARRQRDDEWPRD
jgi:hypothetical protein